MLPFGVTIPATVPQRSEIPEELMNYHVYKATLLFSNDELEKIFSSYIRANMLFILKYLSS
jgi:hypothetical protein